MLKIYEKARQMKKAFCSDNSAGYFLRKKFDPRLILVFPKLPQQKKGNLGNISQPQPVHFSASASKIRLRLRKTFPRFPFFYFGNLGKTKIRRGQIFPQSSQHNFQNKILFFSCRKMSTFAFVIRMVVMKKCVQERDVTVLLQTQIIAYIQMIQVNILKNVCPFFRY